MEQADRLLGAHQPSITLVWKRILFHRHLTPLALVNPHLDGGPFYWPAGPVGVLLIHGFTATTVEVRDLAESLLDAGYTVSAPLLPGHYTQPTDLNRVRWQEWVETVELSYAHLADECHKVVVGGESTGGLLALNLASCHPEVAAVLAYAPALRLQISAWDRLRLRLLAPFIPYVPKPNSDQDTRWQGYPVNPVKGTLQLLRLQQELRHSLQAIQQPLLVVQGRLDRSVHPSVPEQIISGVNSQVCELHWMEHSRHVVLLDDELDQVVKITLDFLSRVLSPAYTPVE
jgi:carboxylesterase